MKQILLTIGICLLTMGVAVGQVRINEVRSNDAGTDDIEFVELIGTAGTDLTGYKIYHVDGSGDSQIFSFTIGSFTIPDDGITDFGSNALGFYVLGTGGNSTGVDETETTNLQGGPDGIILYDASNNVVDAVAWGGVGDISTDITTSGSSSADNYLHQIGNDANDDKSLQAPNDVVGDNGSGWTYDTATPGAINSGQTSGSIILATSIKAEPTNHVTAFIATGSINKVNLAWTDATGSPAPDAYLIKASTTSFAAISNPVDATAEADDSDLSDGSGALNVTFGAETASFTGLNELTTYYFKIYPYTNSGTDIDYKTDGTIPQDDATTLDTPDIVINEILADPADGLTGDANGDGVRHVSDDEFVELVNTGTADLDISNWVISDGADRHTFAASTILKPGQAVVVFGGGTPTGTFGNSLVFTASSGNLGLANSGDDVTLKNASGVVVKTYTYGSEGGNDESLSRDPDLTGSFKRHSSITGVSALFSPGTKSDGTYFGQSVVVSGSEGWRMLSTPTSNNSYDDLLGNIWTQGIGTGADATIGTANVQLYNTATDAFTAVTNLNNTMTAGVGFITYVYSDDDFDGTAEGFPKTLSMFGTENTGTITPTLNDGTSGDASWTLVGNPYASTIDWDLLDKTNLTGTVYVYDHSYGTPSGGVDSEESNTSGSYRAWNGSAGSLTDGLITPFQGFWVQNSASSPSLNIEETDKVTGGTFYKEVPTPTMKLMATMGDLTNDAYFSFTTEGEIGKDNYDGLELSPLDFVDYLSLSSNVGDEIMDINNLPLSFENEISVPVQINAYTADLEAGKWIPTTGEVTITWPELSNIPEGWTVTLHDYGTGASVNVKEENSYTFSLEIHGKSAKAKTIYSELNPIQVTKEKSNAQSRMGITITPSTAVSNEDELATVTKFDLDQNYPNPFNPTTTIKYSVGETGPVSLTVYNVMGQKVAELVNATKTAGTYQINWNATGQASGIYYYRLQAPGQVITRQMTLIK